MKLFNQIRFKTIEGKRLKNYLVYAIGEIILVVIGILIALYINNWNNTRQLKQTNSELQNKVLVQLNEDLNHIERFKNELDTLNQVYLRVLNREYDQSKVSEEVVISTILFDVKDLGLDKQNLNWIDNASLDNSEASENLINLSGVYKLYFKNIDDVEQVIYEKFAKNLEFLESTQPWYTTLITDFKCGNACATYLFENEDHKARIASLRFLYVNGYGDLVNGFSSELKQAKEELEQLIKTN